MKKLYVLLLILLVSLISLAANTGNKSLVYTGRILKPDGSPLQAPGVTFNIGIYTPGTPGCLLYKETQVLNLSGTMGVFSLKVGEGTKIGGYFDGSTRTTKRTTNLSLMIWNPILK